MKTTALILAAFGFVSCGGEIDSHKDCADFCAKLIACSTASASILTTCKSNCEDAATATSECESAIHDAATCMVDISCDSAECDVKIVKATGCN